VTPLAGTCGIRPARDAGLVLAASGILVMRNGSGRAQERRRRPPPADHPVGARPAAFGRLHARTRSFQRGYILAARSSEKHGENRRSHRSTAWRHRGAWEIGSADGDQLEVAAIGEAVRARLLASTAAGVLATGRDRESPRPLCSSTAGGEVARATLDQVDRGILSHHGCSLHDAPAGLRTRISGRHVQSAMLSDVRADARATRRAPAGGTSAPSGRRQRRATGKSASTPWRTEASAASWPARVA
jgi:hypothetical protein